MARAAATSSRACSRRCAPRASCAGDRVAGFVPNMPETIVAMLAAASLGAVWSSCSPDFGVAGRARPLRPDRAQGALHRRRLPLRRQAASTASRASPRSCRSCRASQRVVVRALRRRAAATCALPREGAAAGGFHRALHAASRSSSRGCPSTTRSTSCTPRAPRARRSASCTARAARCCSISRSISCTPTSSRATGCSTSPPAAG